MAEEKQQDMSHLADRTESAPSHQSSSDAGDEEKALPSAEELPQSSDPEADEKKRFQVVFDDGDPLSPHNWSSGKKAWITIQMGMLCLASTMASSITSPATQVLAEKFGISEELSILGVSLFLLGYVFGPTFFAPISEVYGRRWGMLPGVFILGLFSIGSAVSNSAAAFFVTRFFAGVSGAAAITIAPGALGDFYGPHARGIVMALISVAITGGPTLAPLIGASLTINPHLGWRWTEYIQAIITFFLCIVSVFFLPETYAPVLLLRKAKQMRKDTGDSRYWHPHESEKISMSNVFTKYLFRPLRMFFTEPIMTCITLYTSFVYALIFMMLEVFPIVFAGERGYGPVVSTLPFIAILVGVMCAVPINLSNQPRYKRLMIANKGKPVPEGRIIPMIVGGVLLAGGLFWFGWTAAPRFNVGLPLVGAGLFGAGFNIIFIQALNFLGDTYGPFAASAVAGNTIIRSLVAAGLPLAARPMFLNMGVPHASSLLGGLAVAALPIPVIFQIYGKQLRERSKFAW